MNKWMIMLTILLASQANAAQQEIEISSGQKNYQIWLDDETKQYVILKDSGNDLELQINSEKNINCKELKTLAMRMGDLMTREQLESFAVPYTIRWSFQSKQINLEDLEKAMNKKLKLPQTTSWKSISYYTYMVKNMDLEFDANSILYNMRLSNATIQKSLVNKSFQEAASWGESYPESSGILSSHTNPAMYCDLADGSLNIKKMEFEKSITANWVSNSRFSVSNLMQYNQEFKNTYKIYSNEKMSDKSKQASTYTELSESDSKLWAASLLGLSLYKKSAFTKIQKPEDFLSIYRAMWSDYDHQPKEFGYKQAESLSESFKTYNLEKKIVKEQRKVEITAK